MLHAVPWSVDQVLALAPDPSAAKSGRDLSSPHKWKSFGRSDVAVWGECTGSAAEQCKTVIDLSRSRLSSAPVRAASSPASSLWYCEALRCHSKRRPATTFHAVIGVRGEPDQAWVACADCTGLMLEGAHESELNFR